jgi:hypothetical protein
MRLKSTLISVPAVAIMLLSTAATATARSSAAEPGPRMKRRTSVLAVLLLLASLVSVVATQSPASADDRCDPNSSYAGPYWWASVGATNANGGRMVLAVSPPWNSDSYAYIWSMNYDTRQLWYFDCVGYSDYRQRNIYQVRLASSPDSCLSDYGQGAPALLDDCQPPDWQTWQQWELVYLGQEWIPSEGRNEYAYAIWNSGSGLCLDVYNAQTNSGATVITWPCHGGPNQRWF